MRPRALSTVVAIAIAIATLTALALAGCASADVAAGTAEPSPQSQAVAVTDAWVKAAPSGMTGGFGIVTNRGSAPVTIVEVAADASTSAQLHETVQEQGGSMAMRERKGGFTIPAHGSLTLAPGGDHLMMMDLTRAISPGDTVSFTLTMTDGTTYGFTAPAKEYPGANENYSEGGMGATPGPADAGMDMNR